jgi:hypothetical protein
MSGAILLLAAALLELPAGVHARLDQTVPGWKLSPVAPQISDWFRDYRLDYQANLIKGDFDGDGRADYALQVLAHGKQVLVVVLERKDGYAAHVLAEDKPDPFVFLLRYDKGSKDFDFDKLKPFRYRTDAVGLMYFDRTPLTFVYRRGHFQKKLSPSDEEVEERR